MPTMVILAVKAKYISKKELPHFENSDRLVIDQTLYTLHPTDMLAEFSRDALTKLSVKAMSELHRYVHLINPLRDRTILTVWFLYEDGRLGFIGVCATQDLNYQGKSRYATWSFEDIISNKFML